MIISSFKKSIDWHSIRYEIWQRLWIDKELIKSLKIVTSNENKLREFWRFWLEWIEMVKWKDLDEVDSWKYDVVVYKSLANDVWTIVEDTSLEIEWESVGVNLKRLLDNLWSYVGKKAEWCVILGYNDWKKIHLFEWIIKGRIGEAKTPGWFWFDPYFYPEASNWLSLSELENIWKKDNYSARNNSVKLLLSWKPKFSVNTNTIPKWKWKYQK